MSIKFKKLFQIFSILFLTLVLACNKEKAKLDPNRGLSAEDKRVKNITEGRGASINSILRNRGKTNYEFSSSNPMWRASLETLDFLPLTTVDYSGGVIITDWYSEDNNKESIKISVRFLSNEIRSDSIKIIIHKKVCSQDMNCNINLMNSNLIKDELRATILRKASLIQKSDKEKK